MIALMVPIVLCAAVVLVPAACWSLRALARWAAPRSEQADARWCSR